MNQPTTPSAARGGRAALWAAAAAGVLAAACCAGPLVLLALGVSGACPLFVHAAERSVTLALPTMDCPVCPITVKKALSRVAGVVAVQVDFERRSAVVTFDDKKVAPEALAKATAQAGYPSTIKSVSE